MLYADTGIVHTKHQVCGIILKHHLADGDDDFAAACELYGVRQEVDDDLADTQLVALYAVDGHILKVDLVVDAALLKLLCEHIIQAVAQLTQAERFFLKLDLAGLDARHIQNVVDERKQVVGKLVRLVEVLERLAVPVEAALRERHHVLPAQHNGHLAVFEHHGALNVAVLHGRNQSCAGSAASAQHQRLSGERRRRERLRAADRHQRQVRAERRQRIGHDTHSSPSLSSLHFCTELRRFCVAKSISCAPRETQYP